MSSDQNSAEKSQGTPLLGLAVGLTLVVVGLAFFISAFSLPNPKFDPVGPSGLPKIASAVLIVLCLGVVVAEFGRIKNLLGQQLPLMPRLTGNVLPTLILSVAAIAYVSALIWLSLGFATTTFLFVYIGGLILAPINARTLVGLAVLAAIIGFGSAYVLSDVLGLVLPGAGQ